MIDEDRLGEILRDGVALRQVEPRIYSVLPAGQDADLSYDKAFGFFYDLIARSPAYNRLVWGYQTREYQDLCLAALRSSLDGWVLDDGCGSLVFTARTYAGYSDRPVILLDRSIRLLRMAKARLKPRHEEMPANLALIHGDALQLPFRPGSFETIISLNLLHVLGDLRGAVREMKRVLRDGGTLSLTTLVEGDRLGDRYLHMWGRAGELIPRRAEEIVAAFAEVEMPVECQIKGNLALVRHGVHATAGKR